MNDKAQINDSTNLSYSQFVNLRAKKLKKRRIPNLSKFIHFKKTILSSRCKQVIKFICIDLKCINVNKFLCERQSQKCDCTQDHKNCKFKSIQYALPMLYGKIQIINNSFTSLKKIQQQIDELNIIYSDMHKRFQSIINFTEKHLLSGFQKILLHFQSNTDNNVDSAKQKQNQLHWNQHILQQSETFKQPQLLQALMKLQLLNIDDSTKQLCSIKKGLLIKHQKAQTILNQHEKTYLKTYLDLPKKFIKSIETESGGKKLSQRLRFFNNENDSSNFFLDYYNFNCIDRVMICKVRQEKSQFSWQKHHNQVEILSTSKNNCYIYSKDQYPKYFEVTNLQRYIIADGEYICLMLKQEDAGYIQNAIKLDNLHIMLHGTKGFKDYVMDSNELKQQIHQRVYSITGWELWKLSSKKSQQFRL